MRNAKLIKELKRLWFCHLGSWSKNNISTSTIYFFQERNRYFIRNNKAQNNENKKSSRLQEQHNYKKNQNLSRHYTTAFQSNNKANNFPTYQYIYIYQNQNIPGMPTSNYMENSFLHIILHFGNLTNFQFRHVGMSKMCIQRVPWRIH